MTEQQEQAVRHAHARLYSNPEYLEKLIKILSEHHELQARCAKLEACCAAQRNTIEIFGSQNHNLECPNCTVCEAVEKALKDDFGTGWHSPEDYQRKCDECETLKAQLRGLINT